MKIRKDTKPPSLIYLTLGVKKGKHDRHYKSKISFLQFNIIIKRVVYSFNSKVLFYH